MASAKLANVSASLFAVLSPPDRYMDTQQTPAVNTAVGTNGALNHLPCDRHAEKALSESGRWHRRDEV